ncbi:Uu.00g062660.m01.CDS01 [Anthostomella pinea]|uniref:Uu.00g062660.m01.CDS01 n=1 Tax=Anthostomella pinea TaxID=933095 RepID=A0AAI8YN19_9PEZI|nr:Uu.00g062660.m01.CDS01 [Anthostomella pinea]
MAPPLIHIISLISLDLALLPSPPTTGFKDSCDDTWVAWYNTYITVKCDIKTDKGSQRAWTTIDMSGCYTNYDGSLIFTIEGNAGGSCESCARCGGDEGCWTCQCHRDDTTMKNSTLQLGSGLGGDYCGGPGFPPGVTGPPTRV